MTRTPTICLAMIVRDEAQVVERAIASALAFVSSWRVIDTGSRDETPEMVMAALGHLPGELRRSEWLDFGHNRSELLTWARGTAEWLLLLDADMTVESDGDVALRLSEFEHDAALLKVDGGVSYRMPYLVRSEPPWHFVGRTHEYLACDQSFSTGWFDSLRLVHHGDGGSRSDKVERDLRMLNCELLDDPSNPRTHFYLGQTLRDAGDLELAAEHYDRRVTLGGWDEEVFYAEYQLGLIEATLGRDRASNSLLSAWDRRPTRAEPLYHLARINRIAGRHQLSWVFSSLASGIPMPDDLLFVEPWLYRWGISFERCDAAWRIGHDELASTLCRELLDMDGIPDDHMEHLQLIASHLGIAHSEDPVTPGRYAAANAP